MSLPKKLEKLRDESSEKYGGTVTLRETRIRRIAGFNSGFNAACELLLPEIEKIRNSLIELVDMENLDVERREHSDYCMNRNSGECGCAYGEARKALKQWQEFLEG